MPSTNRKDPRDAAALEMDALTARAEKLAANGPSKNPKKNCDHLEERLALARDVIDLLSKQVRNREGELNRESDALETKQKQTEREIADLESSDDKSFDDCLRLTALREYLNQVAKQQARFQEELSRSDSQIRERLKRLAAPLLTLAYNDTAGALLQEIADVIRPYCSGDPGFATDPIAFAATVPAYKQADLRCRVFRDAIASTSILPEALALAIETLLTEQVSKLEKLVGTSASKT